VTTTKPAVSSLAALDVVVKAAAPFPPNSNLSLNPTGSLMPTTNQSVNSNIKNTMSTTTTLTTADTAAEINTFKERIAKLQTLMIPHTKTTLPQRVQSYCVKMNGVKYSEFFSNESISLSDKVAYLDGVINILERKAWDELPSAPNGQAVGVVPEAPELPPAPKVATPAPKAEQPKPAAPKPKPAAPKPAAPVVTAPVPPAPAATDPFSVMLEPMVLRILRQHQPDAASGGLTEEQVRVIASEETRAVLHRIFGQVAAALAPKQS